MKHTRVRRVAGRLLPLALCLLPACQQQMASQPSYRPHEENSFFPDGRAERPPVPGTVARGHLRTDLHLFAGQRAGARRNPVVPAALVGAGLGNPLATLGFAAAAATEEDTDADLFPFPVTAEVLKHGQHRYLIYCVVCHDALGTGHGTIVQRGYTPPPSFHIERLRRAPPGHFFEITTKGYGSMPSYKSQVPPRDRWAIAAYIRALQLSQHFPEKDLPADLRKEWKDQGAAVAGGRTR